MIYRAYQWYTGLQIRLKECVWENFFLYFSSKTYVVGAQKNCLMFKLMGKKIIQFHTHKISLSGPMDIWANVSECQQLLTFVKDTFLSYTQWVTEPTRITDTPSSTLEFFLTTNEALVILIQTLIFFFIWFFTSHQQSFSYVGTSIPGLNRYKARINVSCSRTQRSDAGEARTPGQSVLSQVLYHWSTDSDKRPDKQKGFWSFISPWRKTKVVLPNQRQRLDTCWF